MKVQGGYTREVTMRRRTSVWLLAIAVGAGAIWALNGVGAVELSPGTWVETSKELTPDLKLVVHDEDGGRLTGYLMMKVDGQWKRVVLYDPDMVGAIPAR